MIDATRFVAGFGLFVLVDVLGLAAAVAVTVFLVKADLPVARIASSEVDDEVVHLVCLIYFFS